MTDMRRTLLWVIFTMSLVLLWDKWTVHTGQPSMFGGSPRPVATEPASPAAAVAPPRGRRARCDHGGRAGRGTGRIGRRDGRCPRPSRRPAARRSR